MTERNSHNPAYYFDYHGSPQELISAAKRSVMPEPLPYLRFRPHEAEVDARVGPVLTWRWPSGVRNHLTV
jgi:hypothetical protein